MPQLDHITFLSQVFWLIFIFLSFYLITLKYLLPTISQILKIRKKKIEYNNRQLTSFKEEESLITENCQTILRNSFIESKQLLSNTIQSSFNWLHSSIKKTNETMLLEMNKEYVKTVGEISGKKHLIQNCIQSKE